MATDEQVEELKNAVIVAREERDAALARASESNAPMEIANLRASNESLTRDLDRERDNYAAREQEAERLRQRVVELNQAVNMERERFQALHRTHEQFRAQVRELAIETAANEGWCNEGLNRALEELGLPGTRRDFTVDVSINVSRTISITVEAVDEDEARREVEDNDSAELLRQADLSVWEWSLDDYEITDVNED